MKTSLRISAAVLLAALLVRCGGTPTDPSDADLPDVIAARRGAEWSARLMRESLWMGLVRPSALIGAYAAHYLLHTATFRGALDGIEAAMRIMLDEQSSLSPSFAMLQDLGILLQTDIPDMLNRSEDRPRTFDAYLEGLRDMLETSSRQHEALEQQLEETNGERRDARSAVSTLQSDLRRALREQDYGSASSLQERLIEAESDLAELEARQDELRSIARLFEDLIDVGEDRYTAMNANREALLAGITVTELPGIDDLGILMEGSRSRNRGGIFDLSDI